MRQARIERHDPTNWSSNGVTLTRLVWTDARGETGRSRAVTADRLPKVGTTIIVYEEPRTGRDWWEDEF